MTTLEGVTTYGYDADGRLISVVLPNGRAITYGYDAADNRTVVSDNGNLSQYSTNDLNEYLAFGDTTQVFDAAGNLVSSSDSAGSHSFSYNVDGRLVGEITPQGSWTYEYDVFGNRIASTHAGVRTEYLVDPFGMGDVVAEYTGAGSLKAHYVHGYGLTSRTDVSGQSAYYQFDAVGNTTELTGFDGSVENAYGYLPFGE
jgi:YD repeat-containing protein